MLEHFSKFEELTAVCAGQGIMHIGFHAVFLIPPKLVETSAIVDFWPCTPRLSSTLFKSH